MTEDGEHSIAEEESAADEPEDSDEGPVEPIAQPPDTDGEDEGEQFTAVVREVEEVPASNVPTEYPTGIDTAEAIAVRLTVRKTEEPVFVCYFEPTERGPDDRLARLLAVAGVSSAE